MSKRPKHLKDIPGQNKITGFFNKKLKKDDKENDNLDSDHPENDNSKNENSEDFYLIYRLPWLPW